MEKIQTIDIFCQIIDNFGDAGVCWRLAKIMARDHQMRVNLYIDQPQILEAVAAAERADFHELTIKPWPQNPADYKDCGAMVIEAFGCMLPDFVIECMMDKKRAGDAPHWAPHWIDLEYLSVEEWVKDAHAIKSTHPTTGLQKTLFFPGFESWSGGVLREADYKTRRDQFLNDWRELEAFCERIDMPQNIRAMILNPDHNKSLPRPILISYFAYSNAPLEQLLDIWAHANRSIILLAPVADFDASKPARERGSVQFHEIPFMSQPDYDRLLMICDLNFVRGEDSFVRAQLAGKPMIWDIYKQPDNAHTPKLRAFLSQYCRSFNKNTRETLAKCFEIWNERDLEDTAAWLSMVDQLDAIRQGAAAWAEFLIESPSLTERLLAFCEMDTHSVSNS